METGVSKIDVETGVSEIDVETGVSEIDVETGVSKIDVETGVSEIDLCDTTGENLNESVAVIACVEQTVSTESVVI